MAGLLENRSDAVEITKDDRQSLNSLAATNFDSAPIDLKMPKIDGVEAAHNIRARE